MMLSNTNKPAAISQYLPTLEHICSNAATVLVDNHAGKDGAEDGNLVDFRGNPVDKSRTGGWLAAGLILGTELSERSHTWLEIYIFHPPNLPTLSPISWGHFNLLGLLGGFLADAKLGRYLTVAIFASIAAVVRFLSKLKIEKLFRISTRKI
ncbi:hypothetical protein H5410_037915 [Solanum commersonii]|uniref:Uncharacterized protein n=1 Tax=Solanum commersonii TaxID=4109 RepID=A0A9J5Y7K8_SOLCO|nr:hypothetical protein H5410_037915 [Solanum commersonii]